MSAIAEWRKSPQLEGGSRPWLRAVRGLALIAGLWPLVSASADADPCAPVPGNAYWTAEELSNNEIMRRNFERVVGKPFPGPVVSPLLWKYEKCQRWMRDSETFVVHDLLSNYEAMQGIPRLFDKAVDVVLWGRQVLSKSPSGLLGSIAEPGVKHGAGVLASAVFDNPDDEVRALLEGMFLDFQKRHPNDSLSSILDRVKGELTRQGGGFDNLKPETIDFLETSVMKMGLRQVLSDWKPRQPTDGAVRSARDKVKAFDAEISKRSKDIAEVKENAAKAARSVVGAVSRDNSTDWTKLSGVYRHLVSTEGRAAAERLMQAAASDPITRQKLGLTEREASALAVEVSSKIAIREAGDAARDVAKKSRELAQLANNLGWGAGAESFANLASVATAFEGLAESLAASVGPPGPWQMISTANAMFSMAGALSRTFGGRKKKDDGLGRALVQIMQGLKAISSQLAEMRKEQREHFEYAERHLEVLVELASTEALGGTTACQRVLSSYSRWSETADSTDIRVALDSSSPADDLSQRAVQCLNWLWDPRAIPIKSDGTGVNVVYKQLLSTAGAVAGRHSVAMAEFKNRGFVLAERHFPALRSLMPNDEATQALQDRTLWGDSLASRSPDVYERLSVFGGSTAAAWTVGRLSEQMLSTPTVMVAAEAALLLQPAAAQLPNPSEKIVGGVQADKAHAGHVSLLRDLYALSLIALAQERLIAGVPIAERVDALLAEHDARLGKDSASLESCETVPKADAKTMCARLGKKAFDDRVAAAIQAIQAFPTLRQNVLAARMWRVSNREGHNTRWMPRYAVALGLRVEGASASDDPGAIVLNDLFPGLGVTTLPNTKVSDRRNDEYIDNGIYFARLAGKCSGIPDRSLLGVAACNGIGCSYNIGKTPEGEPHIVKGQELRRPDEQDAEACVMAALPDATEFSAGRINESAALASVRELVDRLAAALAFDVTYSQRQTRAERWFMLDSMRPAIGRRAGLRER